MLFLYIHNCLLARSCFPDIVITAPSSLSIHVIASWFPLVCCCYIG